MTRFADHLWSDLVEEHGSTLSHADRPQRARARLLQRPRILAGSTLGLGGVITALVFAFSAAGSVPAFAVTTTSSGSVLVSINETASLPQANAKLASMGISEQVSIFVAYGPASVSGPVTCTPASSVSGPQIQVLIGTDGTEVIKPGETADNTGVGTFHLVSCSVVSAASGGVKGNSGVS